MSAIRVAIADDQVLFCSGMRMLVESQPDLAFAGAAHTGDEAVDLAGREHPDVILMDIRMPGIDGIEATARIVAAAESPETAPKVIVLTTFQRDEAVARAIRAGAHGFVMKDTTPEFVLAAIRTVHAGHSVIAPRDIAALLAPQGGGNGAGPAGRPGAEGARGTYGGLPAEDVLEPLSTREKEVFLLAARGLSNAEAGQVAFISEATVKSHMRSILAKLGLASRVQLVAFAYENGLMR
ncbi:response regulator [Kitasatospora herbaricolor]|uniref:response regulator transcription factor n=1 Tax=Kitasatospora herbaricolor TaxID=68217 RepID=UPI0036DB3FF0